MARVLIKDQEGTELCKLDARHSDIRDSEFGGYSANEWRC